jgi:hypothetical protein
MREMTLGTRVVVRRNSQSGVTGREFGLVLMLAPARGGGSAPQAPQARPQRPACGPRQRAAFTIEETNSAGQRRSGWEG